MGTTGPDKFREYRESPKKDKPKAPPKGGAGPRGRPPGEPQEGTNKCEEPITNVALEEVARSEYYSRHAGVPPIGTEISVRRALVHGRIGVVTGENEVLGYLPVEYNHILRCMQQGFSYSGQVVVSSNRPVPTVRVTLTGQQ